MSAAVDLFTIVAVSAGVFFFLAGTARMVKKSTAALMQRSPERPASAGFPS